LGGQEKPVLVSLVLPIKNEAAHLARSLDAIDRQTYPAGRIEIIAVDGGSTDGTLDILRDREARDSRIQILGGPGVNTPAAMNIGVESARGSIVAKIDGHGWINESFVADAVAILETEADVGCVGGLVVPVADTNLERSVAYARFSVLGVGGGIYTASEQLQEANTVQCGVYRRQALVDAGGFDPDLVYGEDEEANYRLRLAGWRIVLQPTMRFNYRVRPNPRELFRQYFRYGRARVSVVRKHPSFFSPKHAAPALAVAVLGLGGLATVDGRTRTAGLLVWTAYLAVIGGGGLLIAVRRNFRRPDLVAASIAALHLGYGLGTLGGLRDLLLSRRTKAQKRVERSRAWREAEATDTSAKS
jgi:glycosyltransferase involved in cell wall biosynthesis